MLKRDATGRVCIGWRQSATDLVGQPAEFNAAPTAMGIHTHPGALEPSPERLRVDLLPRVDFFI